MTKTKKLTMAYKGRKFVLVAAPGGICAGCAFAGDAEGCKATGECAGGMWREYETDRYEVDEELYGVMDDKEGRYDRARLHNV